MQSENSPLGLILLFQQPHTLNSHAITSIVFLTRTISSYTMMLKTIQGSGLPVCLVKDQCSQACCTPL